MLPFGSHQVGALHMVLRRPANLHGPRDQARPARLGSVDGWPNTLHDESYHLICSTIPLVLAQPTEGSYFSFPVHLTVFVTVFVTGFVTVENIGVLTVLFLTTSTGP